MREQFRSDRGASIFMLAISLFLLIGASALAVDIGAIWLDRSTDQKVTDAAAAVGVLEAFGTGGKAACESALTYVAVNTSDLGSVDTTGCASEFGGICDASLPPRELEVSEGRYEITVVYPVGDTHDMMTSRIVSRTPQTLVADDGEPCDRLGVKMASTRDSLFASVLGFGSGTTTVHTVAMRIVGDERPPLNLIVLDRTGCNAISVNGGGQIIAEPVIDYDPNTGNPTGLVPGLVIADSNGSGCGGSNGVINVSGAGSVIRSDGPECGNGQPTYSYGGYTAQEGCGRIQVVAPGTPGCNLPACSVSGGANQPNPPPTPLGSPYTRQPADHKYNCYSDYTTPPIGTTWAADPLTTGNQQNIDPCEAGTDDYMYDLIDFVGPATDGKPDSTFRFWQADLGLSCNPNASIPPVNENVVFDCPLLLTSGISVTINGNVVFNQNVTVNGSLTINPPAAKPWIFFRGGRLSKAGSGKIAFNDAMVYMAKGSEIKLSGGSGSLIWTAPTSGDFADLALWTDSTAGQAWSGQAALGLRGIFFMPRATASYSGTGGQIQTDAQWLAWRLEVGGGAVLRIAPSEGSLPAFADRSTLIR
ncbi:MAG TPA: Tad domain-containing protein [Acidimicrobiia bacterium]|nr:Tad domain-containing protein [Acidimicrobiia bacterium]